MNKLLINIMDINVIYYMTEVFQNQNYKLILGFFNVTMGCTVLSFLKYAINKILEISVFYTIHYYTLLFENYKFTVLIISYNHENSDELCNNSCNL